MIKLFGFGNEKKPRRNFSKSQKDKNLARQNNKCAKCKKSKFGSTPAHFDHKDGNRNNNDTSNGQALCPNCHAGKSNKETTVRAKKQKKEREDPFGLGDLSFGFGDNTPKKRKKKKKSGNNNNTDEFGYGDLGY